MIYILGVNEHLYQAVNPKTNPVEAKFYDYVLKHVRAKMISHLRRRNERRIPAEGKPGSRIGMPKAGQRPRDNS